MKYEECCICLDNLNNSNDNIKILRCGHVLHKNCKIKLQNSGCENSNKCPLCREIIDTTIENEKKYIKDNKNENSRVRNYS